MKTAEINYWLFTLHITCIVTLVNCYAIGTCQSTCDRRMYDCIIINDNNKSALSKCISNMTTLRCSILTSQLTQYTGWAKKTGPVWALITQRRLHVERRVICQKF